MKLFSARHLVCIMTKNKSDHGWHLLCLGQKESDHELTRTLNLLIRSRTLYLFCHAANNMKACKQFFALGSDSLVNFLKSKGESSVELKAKNCSTSDRKNEGSSPFVVAFFLAIKQTNTRQLYRFSRNFLAEIFNVVS